MGGVEIGIYLNQKVQTVDMFLQAMKNISIDL